MTTETRTPSRLIDLARAAYAARTIVDAEQLAEREGKAAEEFLTVARSTARDVLGEPADDLPWRYTPWAQAPEDTEEATAALPPGIRHRFALRYAHTVEGDSSTRVGLALVQTCNSCGCTKTRDVTSLEHLGQLIDQAESVSHTTSDAQDSGESQPLKAIAMLHTLAGRIGELAHRLTDAGLTVDMASIYSSSTGSTTSKLRADSDTAEAVIDAAATLGLEVKVDVHVTAGGTYVFRRADASGIFDGIAVDIIGHTQLPAEEADAWRAQQNQTAEPVEASENR